MPSICAFLRSAEFCCCEMLGEDLNRGNLLSSIHAYQKTNVLTSVRARQHLNS